MAFKRLLVTFAIDSKYHGDETWEVYYRFRDKIETPQNIGKLIFIDTDSSDYAIAPNDFGLAEKPSVA